MTPYSDDDPLTNWEFKISARRLDCLASPISCARFLKRKPEPDGSLSRNSTTTACGFDGRSRQERMTSLWILTRIEPGSAYPSPEWSAGGCLFRLSLVRSFWPSSCSPCDYVETILASNTSSVAPEAWTA